MCCGLARLARELAHELTRAGSLENRARMLAWLATKLKRVKFSRATNKPSRANYRVTSILSNPTHIFSSLLEQFHQLHVTLPDVYKCDAGIFFKCDADISFELLVSTKMR